MILMRLIILCSILFIVGCKKKTKNTLIGTAIGGAAGVGIGAIAGGGAGAAIGGVSGAGIGGVLGNVMTDEDEK